MPQTTGWMVENITKAGSSENGEFVRLTLVLKGGREITLFFPFKFFSGLMTALFAAGTNAHEDQLKAKGSEQNLLTMLGTVVFEPNGYSLGRGKNLQGDDALVIRLKKDGLPLVDVGFQFEGARQIAKEMLQEIEKGPAPLPTQN